MCSTFKAYASARVLQMAEHGQLSLDGRCSSTRRVVANSPVTERRAGGEMTLAELCQAALQEATTPREPPVQQDRWTAVDHRVRAKHRR